MLTKYVYFDWACELIVEDKVCLQIFDLICSLDESTLVAENQIHSGDTGQLVLTFLQKIM